MNYHVAFLSFSAEQGALFDPNILHDSGSFCEIRRPLYCSPDSAADERAASSRGVGGRYSQVFFFPSELPQIDVVCRKQRCIRLCYVPSLSLAGITRLSYILCCRHTWTFQQCEVLHQHESHSPERRWWWWWLGELDQACKQRLPSFLEPINSLTKVTFKNQQSSLAVFIV